jgi:hypothetical protein
MTEAGEEYMRLMGELDALSEAGKAGTPEDEDLWDRMHALWGGLTQADQDELTERCWRLWRTVRR